MFRNLKKNINIIDDFIVKNNNYIIIFNLFIGKILDVVSIIFIFLMIIDEIEVNNLLEYAILFTIFVFGFNIFAHHFFELYLKFFKEITTYNERSLYSIKNINGYRFYSLLHYIFSIIFIWVSFSYKDNGIKDFYLIKTYLILIFFTSLINFILFLKIYGNYIITDDVLNKFKKKNKYSLV